MLKVSYPDISEYELFLAQILAFLGTRNNQERWNNRNNTFIKIFRTFKEGESGTVSYGKYI